MNGKRVENHEKSTPGDSKITQIWCLGYPWEAIKTKIQKKMGGVQLGPPLGSDFGGKMEPKMEPKIDKKL